MSDVELALPTAEIGAPCRVSDSVVVLQKFENLQLADNALCIDTHRVGYPIVLSRRILDRQTLTEIPGSAIGSRRHLAGQFRGLHGIGTDSKGNLFTVDTRNARLQKFVNKGLSTR